MAEPVGSGGEGVAVTGARTVASAGHASRNGPHGENNENHANSAVGGRPRRPGRWVIMAIAGGLAVVLGAWKGGPWVRDYFSHVSTDDAFVAGDATMVASRLVLQRHVRQLSMAQVIIFQDLKSFLRISIRTWLMDQKSL